MKKWSIALAATALLSLSFLVNVQGTVSAAQTATNTTQKNQGALEFYPWDAVGGGYAFTSNGKPLPEVILSSNGPLTLYRVVYIGNATYMGYYH